MASEKIRKPRAAIAGGIHAKILSDSDRKNQQSLNALAGGIHAKILPDSLAGGIHANIMLDSQSKNKHPLFCTETKKTQNFDIRPIFQLRFLLKSDSIF